MTGITTYTSGFSYYWVDQNARGYIESLRKRLRASIRHRRTLRRINLPFLRKAGRVRKHRYPMMEQRSRLYRF